MQIVYFCAMRVTIEVDEETLQQVQKMTGEKQKSRALAKAVGEYLNRRKAREFGRLLREGAFDYPTTNEEIEEQDI